MRLPAPALTEIDDDRSRLDFPHIHAWLSASYGSPGIPLDVPE